MGKRNYYSLIEAQNGNKNLQNIIHFIDFSLDEYKEFFDFENDVGSRTFKNLEFSKFSIDYERQYTETKKEKKFKNEDSEFNEEMQNPGTIILREPSYDRKHNLDTVIINDFNKNHDKDVDNAIVHLGLYADEYARSFRAMAFTIANHIYFRKGAYKPESEEGRKLIAHELTHVAQNKLKNENLNTTKEELEKEAEKEEIKEQYNPEKIVIINVGNKTYKVTEKNAQIIDYYVEQELEDWVEREVEYLPEERALQLLINYKKYLERKKRIWKK